MATVRWTFTDPVTHEVYTLPMNPKSMTSPIPVGNAGTTAAGVRTGADAPATWLRRGAPVEWSFAGSIRSRAHYEAMKAWHQRPGKVLVTDHLQRTFECFLQDFDAPERKTNRANPDRWTYTMKALVLRQTA